MNPLILASLLGLAPGFLSKLFGGDPMAEYRKKVAQLTSPENIGKLTNNFYQQALSSPAYSQAQGQIAGGANVAGNTIAQNLAARGIGTSGTGAILPGLVSSLVGQQQAGLRTGAYNAAQGQAQNSIQAQLQALAGSQGPSQTQQLLGGGLEALQPILQAFLKTKYPGFFGGGDQTGMNFANYVVNR